MSDDSDLAPTLNRCPECENSLNISDLPPFAKVTCPECGSAVRVRTTMGQYQITQLLGEGGMSQVFKAVDLYLRREVALKVLHQSLSQDAALTSMFEREAKLTASILHPNVVKVYTVGGEDGYFFIAMELVETTSLEQLIASKGALSEQNVLSVAADVTSGLRAAYEEDLIHRDIKPGNMLVTEEGTTKLVDFGLAVQQGIDDETEDLWATPFYVPPEKLEGEPDSYLGDIYSLGATLYHALAGKPPFEANTSSLEELKEIKKQPVDLKSDAPGLSKATVKLVEKMMSYDAADRPQDYTELLEEIDGIRKRNFGVETTRTSPGGQKKAIATLGIVLLVLAGLAAFGVMFFGRDNGGAEELGIGTGERLISAGEETGAEIFLKGRREFTSGNYKAAAETFDSLTGVSSLSPVAEMWRYFFLGMIDLFRGNETDSRVSFGMVKAVRGEVDEQSSIVAEKLTEMASKLARPLPVLESSLPEKRDDLGAIGLLASGLKNWQLGQFESARIYFDAFESSTPPPELVWMEELKQQLKPFRADLQLLSNLPNPSRKRTDDLTEAKKSLQEALDKVKTRGALPQLIKDRIARIDEIEKIIAEEKKAAEIPEPGTSVTESKPPPQETGMGEWDAEALAEKDRLKAVIAQNAAAMENFQFSSVAGSLQSEEVFTEKGKRLKLDLLHAYDRAGQFIEKLAAILNVNRYEGVVRRKEGKPLDAFIAEADSSRFVVDLGFGPNEVEVELFAADWLVEAARQSFPAMGEESVETWETLAFFAMATGQREAFKETADSLIEIAPQFADRLETISKMYE